MFERLRPIRCQSCGKLICEADGTVVFRCSRCKRRNTAVSE
jgi:phage FluMu protein Com